jgi:hypothetical protein
MLAPDRFGLIPREVKLRIHCGVAGRSLRDRPHGEVAHQVTALWLG